MILIVAGVLGLGLLLVLGLVFGVTIIALAVSLLVCAKLVLVWLKGSRYHGQETLEGKVAVVTGANVGIGRAVATDLVRRGARVIMGCRDETRAAVARHKIIQETGVKEDMIEFMQLDLSSFQSVRSFASQLSRRVTSLDILVNNAGVAFLTERRMTEDGQEMVMQVNHFSNFLLTNLVSGLLTRAAHSRVVMVSSLAHAWPKHGIQYDDLQWQTTEYSMREVYGQSKLANILFAKEFGRRFQKSGVTTYSVHPGAVITELGRDIKKKLPTFLIPVTDYLANLGKIFFHFSIHSTKNIFSAQITRGRSSDYNPLLC